MSFNNSVSDRPAVPPVVPNQNNTSVSSNLSNETSTTNNSDKKIRRLSGEKELFSKEIGSEKSQSTRGVKAEASEKEKEGDVNNSSTSVSHTSVADRPHVQPADSAKKLTPEEKLAIIKAKAKLVFKKQEDNKPYHDAINGRYLKDPICAAEFLIQAMKEGRVGSDEMIRLHSFLMKRGN